MTADDILQVLSKKINSKPEPTANWGGSIIWNFINTDEAFLMKFGMDGKVANIEKGKLAALKEKKPNAVLNTSTDTMEMINDGILAAAGALQGGQIKIEGSMESVFKLAPALGV
jgi:putative sterol carrier protein